MGFLTRLVPDELLFSIFSRVGYRHNHNWVWLQEARRIGCSGNVFLNIEPVTANWIVTCPCGHVKLPRYKVQPALLRRKCLKCDGQLRAERTAVPERGVWGPVWHKGMVGG
jgi:hypothetical protein